MSNGVISIKVKNSLEELKSFPVDQKLTLEFSQPVEDSFLKSSIHVLQSLDSGSLIHIGDTYNQNVGLVKEGFASIGVVSTVVSTVPFTVEIKPVKPLSPSYTYQLLVQETLVSESVSVDKAVSYSDSTVVVEGIAKNVSDGDYLLEVTADSSFSSSSHLVLLSLNDVETSINLKKTNLIEVSGITLKLSGSAFIEGEAFLISIKKPTATLSSSFSTTFKTASTVDVKPIQDSSTVLTFNDILSFNNPVEDISKDLTYTTTPTGEASFLITFNKPIVPLLDLANFSYTSREAFNMYTLASMGLYTKNAEYAVSVDVLSESQIEVFIERSYEDNLQNT